MDDPTVVVLDTGRRHTANHIALSRKNLIAEVAHRLKAVTRRARPSGSSEGPLDRRFGRIDVLRQSTGAESEPRGPEFVSTKVLTGQRLGTKSYKT